MKKDMRLDHVIVLLDGAAAHTETILSILCESLDSLSSNHSFDCG